MNDSSSRQLACIVLAAGSSTRFGSDKRQARLPDGRSVLAATLQAIPPCFERQLLVLKPEDAALADALPAQWQVVTAAQARLGMGHSLAAGLAACRDCSAVLVVLADMPHVHSATYAKLAAALQRTTLVLPRYQGRRGNPVGIGADFFDSLLQPQGDSGARQLLQVHGEAIVWMDCDDPGILQDIDTPADLQEKD